MTHEQKAAYLKAAAQKIKEQKEKEIEENEKYYTKISTGANWNLFKLGAFLCLLFTILLSVDLYIDGETKPVPLGEYTHDGVTHEKINAAVWVKDEVFTPYYKDFVSVDYESFSITQSAFFNTSKYISFDAHTLGDRERFHAYKRLSLYDFFPYVHLLLLFPILVFFYKRPNAAFSFARRFCIFILYPASVFILISLLI